MWVGGLTDPGLHKEFWQHVFALFRMLQFLGASELALKQFFLFPKQFIIINYLSFTRSLQGRSVAKHQKHRWRKNKRKILNGMVETAERKGNINARVLYEISSYRYFKVNWWWTVFPKRVHIYFLATNKANPSKISPPCLHSFLAVSLIPLFWSSIFSLC